MGREQRRVSADAEAAVAQARRERAISELEESEDAEYCCQLESGYTRTMQLGWMADGVHIRPRLLLAAWNTAIADSSVQCLTLSPSFPTEAIQDMTLLRAEAELTRSVASSGAAAISLGDTRSSMGKARKAPQVYPTPPLTLRKGGSKITIKCRCSWLFEPLCVASCVPGCTIMTEHL